MKMVKSLLLGSAAGLLAVAGAQAADLPVKAKPVEYVKVCSLYGAGFFYIPGTDTCLKIGGFVRVDYGFNAGGSHGQYWSGGNAKYTRDTDDFTTRARFNYTFDARTQTEYGTLRSYIRAGLQYSTDDPDNGVVYYDRGFVQLGPWTFGKTVSFYDAFANPASYTSLVGASDAGGPNVFAYTAQFGNGFSGSISFEDATFRRGGNDQWSAAASAQKFLYSAAAGVVTKDLYGGQQMPDIVGNLRVDQAWGAAQLSVALHEVRANEANRDVNDKFGFAVQGAVQVNLPWAVGDKFWVQGGYSEGAVHYTGLTKGTFNMFEGAQQFLGYAPDAFIVGTDLELTKVFAVTAAIEHYWTPMLRSSLFGAYANVDIGSKANTALCNGNAGCDFDWNMWEVGSRTIWNPVKNLDVGVEVLYSKFEHKHGAYAATVGYVDKDNLSALVRVQRNFWP